MRYGAAMGIEPALPDARGLLDAWRP